MKQYTVQEMDTGEMLCILEKLPFHITKTEYLRNQILGMRDGEMDEVSEKQMTKMLVSLINILYRVRLDHPAIVLA